MIRSRREGDGGGREGGTVEGKGEREEREREWRRERNVSVEEESLLES